MAVAAFKSSSRRGNQSSTPSNTSSSSGRPTNRAPPIRRSRSVSAFSRTNSDLSTEFLNKRDNPLFSTADQTQPTKNLLETSTPAEGIARGRSVARSAEPGRNESGRSLSRADSGRRTRSASQCPVSRRHLNYSTSESEAEFKSGNGLKLLGSNRKGGLVGTSDDGVRDQVKDLNTWSSRHSSIESGLQTQNADDAVSTASSGFGSDEKTIRAVCEQMNSVQGNPLEANDIYETVRSEVKRAISEIQIDLESAIQRSNVTAAAVANVSDIPPDMVNPGAVELVLEIRREYAKKLEESQERARNLRADLAVEEHRGLELDRILKEVLPYPRTPINVQKSRPARKTSIERRRMSKRLAEDAKAYFDECVSLSPFDSSDFSSPEDPPLSLVGPPTPSSSNMCLTEESGTQGQSMNIHFNISQPAPSTVSVGAFHGGEVSSISGNTETGCKSFSFAQKPSESETSGLQQYIKKFEKNVLKLSTKRSNYYDLGEYNFQSSAESWFVERVHLKSRIESGSLLLCGGGNILSSKSYGIGI
ncbi:uncharacterized protein LOC133295430 isoform X2 [Gastrolobium bilobum]|uniref:uncharacterized protein LOC133295430 isoform X2 n=1 Tax=Gastrolobium bilobum TaxID=150636 RepID=UPI002AB02ECA|nr:uncharacterized protein LOC133295430 isoform X2 [Gastrolobium bilobum]